MDLFYTGPQKQEPPHFEGYEIIIMKSPLTDYEIIISNIV